jgi:4-amino-4-deoxy-L-arabinose transferase-like glycosyltransferase
LANVVLPLALLAIMATRLVIAAQTDSLTVDEPLYVESGLCALTTGVIDLDQTNPPIYKILGAAGVRLLDRPATFDCQQPQAVFAGGEVSIKRIALAARLPIIAMGLLLAMVVFLWARMMFGFAAGLLTLGIVSFEPTLLAHAHLVTGDLSLALGLATCLAGHWYWSRTGRKRGLVLAGIGLGWALLSRVSALEFLPVLAVAPVILADGGWSDRLRAAISSFLIVVATAWATVCLLYLPFSTMYGRYQWSPPLAWIAPPQWFDSLSYQLHHIQVGHPAYLNGRLIPAHGFWTYFLEAVALKTTLGLLLLCLGAAIFTVLLRDRSGLVYLWIPIVVIGVVATIGGIEIGVRYLLAVYPLGAVAAGRIMTGSGGALLWSRAAAAVAFFALAVSSLAHAPNDIGYFNELAGGNPAAYLSDSNLDWGQDAWRLKNWWEANGRPAMVTNYFGGLPLKAYGVNGVDPQSQHAKYLAISVQKAIESAPGLIHLEPAQRIGSSILIYQIEP